jgi:hypothetical protein
MQSKQQQQQQYYAKPSLMLVSKTPGEGAGAIVILESLATLL